MCLWASNHGRVHNQPATFFDGSSADLLVQVHGNAQVDGQCVTQGRVDHARTEYVNDYLVAGHTLGELIHKHGAQKLCISVMRNTVEFLLIVEVLENRRAWLHRVFFCQAGIPVSAAADPSDA